MFLLVCGEDSAKSRAYIATLKDSYRKEHASVREIPAKELDDALKSDQVSTLFGESIVYVTQGLFGYWAKHKRKIAPETDALHARSDITVVNWEDGRSLYEMKLKPAPYIKEFKADKSVFDFQEALVPGNKTRFVEMLERLSETQDPFFLFTMVHRHARTLLLLNTAQPAGNMHPYVKQKATMQAKKWETRRLVKFYEGLTKIDRSLKSSGTPFDIHRSLEILACYYL
jgi:hypothetical protein